MEDQEVSKRKQNSSGEPESGWYEFLGFILGGAFLLWTFDLFGLTDLEKGDLGHFKWVIYFYGISFFQKYGNYVWSWKKLKFVPPPEKE